MSRVPDKDKERKAKEIKEFKEVFDIFDKNGDGTISTKELGGVLRGLNQNFNDKQLEMMIQKVDINGDGEIDFDEFLVMMEGHGAFESEVDEMKAAFDVFDKNGDGDITAEELFSVLSKLGLEIDRDTINLMIKSVDINGDGTISYDEFKKMMTDGPS